jgi:hypothetical protein
MGHGNFRIADLIGMAALKLQNGLHDLADTGRSNRMSLGKEPSRRIDRDIAVNRRTPFNCPRSPLPAWHEPEILAVNYLRDGEAIVQLHEIDIFGRHSGLAKGLLRGGNRRIERGQIGMTVQPGGPSRLHTCQDIDVGKRPARGQILRREQLRPRRRRLRGSNRKAEAGHR